MKRANIKYKNIAPQAKENFVATITDTKYNTVSQLQKYNLFFKGYENPCELYSVALDGGALPFPSEPEKSNIGIISNQLSGEDGVFENPIVLTLEAIGKYSSQGITLTFDKYNEIFATDIKVEWYRDNELLSSQTYKPNNSVFVCENIVEFYNKIIITFYSLNMPQNRLKLFAIDYGYEVILESKSLRNVKIIQELDPISSEITINTADFMIDIPVQSEFMFQKEQPLEVYFNDNLKSTTFIKSLKRKSKTLWNIQSEDYIGLMNNIPYYGGMYENQSVIDLLTDIFGVAKVPFELIGDFNNEILTGYIPYTTCRDALMQVAFAIQAVIDTSNSNVVKIYFLGEEISQTVSPNRIMQGQTFGEEDLVTGVELTAHDYRILSDKSEVYNASKSGTGEAIFVKFSEPLHDLEIQNGEIISQHTNYAVINAYEDCILSGQKYEHTTVAKRLNNPLILANQKEKIIEIQNATLVSNANLDNLLEKCYNYFKNSNTVNSKIVEGKHVQYGGSTKYGTSKYGTFKYGLSSTATTVVYDKIVNVGDKITVGTEFKGELTGRVIKQIFNLNGGIIIKDTTMRY